MNTNNGYLLIGGNMGDREAYLSKAMALINERCGKIAQQSSLYETAAWGLQDQAPFLNQALKIETPLSPEELLSEILAIEEMLGRRREIKYGPRIIDIDILFFNDIILESAGLSIPHQQMQNRRFVLAPLHEIAAEKIHPVLKKTITRLLIECPDSLAVQKFQ